MTAAARVRGIEHGAGTRDGIAGGSVAATTETRAAAAKGAEIETGGGERGVRDERGKTTQRGDGWSASARERQRCLR